MRLQEIEKRLKEIKSEIESRGAELTAVELDALEKETTELQTERRAFNEAAEKRTRVLNSIADGSEAVMETRRFPSPILSGSEQQTASDIYGTAEYRRAFMNFASKGTPIPAEYRASETTKTADVGATIPTPVLNSIVEKLETAGNILSLVTRTSHKGGLAIPVSSVKPVATWVSEGSGSDRQKKTTATITFAYHKLRCAVAVSLETDTMSISVFESTLINNVVEAMTIALEKSIISGDGTGKPKGITAETPVSGQVISSTAPSYNDLNEAEAALPQAYESGASWCMSKKTFMQYYGLTDDVGQPIGRVNYGVAGKPERSLLGRPVAICDHIPSYAPALGANTVFAFIFNFKDYILNTNYTMGIKKYEDNDTDDLVTKAVMLADGKVVDKNSLVVIKKTTA